MHESSLTHRAASATWWSTLEIASRYGVQIAVTIVLARLLTPADFGLIAMLLVFTSLGTVLVDSGFSTALIQRKSITADDETTVFIFVLITGVAVATMLWFAAPAIAEFYSQPELTPLTHLVVWVLPLGALAAVPDALLTKRLNFAKRARAEIIASGISGVIAIILAWRGFGVWSMGWQIVMAMGLRAILLWHYAQWMPNGRCTRASFQSLFGFGGFMLLARLLDTAFIRLQALLLGRLFDAGTLGYYTLAQNAQQAPSSFMGTVLNRVGLPVFSQVADRPAKLRNALRLSLRTSLFLFLPCMVGLALVAKPLIILIYGSRWQAAAPILSLLALAAALWPLHVLNLAALTARGRSDLFFQLEVVKKLVSITLVVASSPFGPIAVSFAVLASSIFGVIINTWYAQRMLDYGLMVQLADQKLTFALCVAAAIAAWTILHWTPAGTLPTLTAIVIAAFVYLAGAVVMRSEALAELVHLGQTLINSWGIKKTSTQW
ncbi:lipopolysaccharide biosynthesis protein [Nitrosococcus oceani]|uniref:lipopolysaccharide biosynthesis protein n=1 Tax=Nitrosococcus oceani TaxID=1229 RepID=UPI000689CE27|nr:lipopolysaccharide biosynthesis protein [Nitrosococcus oceani]